MKKIGIVGAPVDLGAKRRGVDMGPSAVRNARIEERLEGLGLAVRDFGNIQSPERSTARAGDPRARFLREVVACDESLAEMVARCDGGGYFPLVLGGDQSVSIGTLAGLARRTSRRGIVWLDAHADFNTTSTTPSGNIHGMALAAILGYGERSLVKVGGHSPMASEANTVIVGGRDFDREEARAVENSKVTVFTMRDIDELGMREVMEQAVRVARKGVNDVHLSFDIDVLDPREAPGTGTPVPGGLSYREAQLAMEMLSDSEVVTSAEFVEVNPVLDVTNRSAETVVQLVLSLFGKNIMWQGRHGRRP
jgi:arginase